MEYLDSKLSLFDFFLFICNQDWSSEVKYHMFADADNNQQTYEKNIMKIVTWDCMNAISVYS